MQIQRGFLDIVPAKVLKDMSVADLEAALAGEPDVDVADWYIYIYMTYTRLYVFGCVYIHTHTYTYHYLQHSSKYIHY